MIPDKRSQAIIGLLRNASIALACCALGWAGPAAAQVYQGPLYDRPAEGSEHWLHDRVVTGEPGREAVYNTREPRITVHLPEPGVANGSAVVMLPGGGLRVLGMGSGMDQEVRGLLELGVAVLVLEYRTLQLDPASLARPAAPAGAPAPSAPVSFPSMVIRNGNANPAPNDPRLAEVLRLATSDARAALKLAHDHAREWRLDTGRIGMIGTSAGGGVAFGTLMADGPEEERPDFVISIFGPALQDMAATEASPPLFLVTEADHGPVTDGLLALFSIWKKAGRKVELHVYEVPNFSMTWDLWGGRLGDWLRERSIIPTSDH